MIDWLLVRDIASWTLILIGSAAVVTGALGLVRFPDFYTRLHAAGVTDTAGAELIIFGMMLQAFSPEYGNGWLIFAKLGFIAVFLALTSPVATYAIAHAAWMVGFRPLVGARLRYTEDGE
jgi:multicomponent Na+:H+ antiporter subunit G